MVTVSLKLHRILEMFTKVIAKIRKQSEVQKIPVKIQTHSS
jgi:hypothetical protein